MRIFFIDEHFNAPENGFINRTYQFGRLLAQKGHPVTVITGNAGLNLYENDQKNSNLELEGMNILALNINNENTPTTEKKVFKSGDFSRQAYNEASKLGRPDIIVVVAHSLNILPTAIRLKKKFKVPLIIEFRRILGKRTDKKGKTKQMPGGIFFEGNLKRKGFHLASKLIALSPEIVTGLLEQDAPAEKIEYIPEAVDTGMFSPGLRDNNFMKKYGLKDNFLSVYYGEVNYSAGLEYFLGAAALLPEDDFSWVIAGSGSATKKLKNKAEKAGLLSRVHFVEDLSAPEISRLFKCADTILAFTHKPPYISYIMPGAFFNGLASGKPLIVNFSGWAADILEKHNAGFLVAPDSVRELATLIESLSKRPELLRKTGDNAFSLAKEQFDIQIIISQYEKILNDSCIVS